MVPSRPHAGTPSICAAQMVRAGPPETSIFLSSPAPLAKKPMNRLSGDQNGDTAPSVPASGCAVSDPSERIQSCCWPLVVATNARCRPSGETAIRVVFSADVDEAFLRAA